MPDHGDETAALAGQLAPTPKLPHLDDPLYRVTTLGVRPDTTPDIFIFHDVLEELCYRACIEADTTSASVLAGDWFVGPHGQYVEIDGFHSTTYAREPTQLLHSLRANPKAVSGDTAHVALGLCITRPGARGQLTPDDFILANTYFNLPFQVLLLIDGPADQLGFYARDEHQRLRNVGAYVLTPADETASGPSDCRDTAGGDSANQAQAQAQTELPGATDHARADSSAPHQLDPATHESVPEERHDAIPNAPHDGDAEGEDHDRDH